MVDQVRPCEDPTLPSFCLALPGASGTTDASTLLAARRDACAQLAPGEAPAFCLTPAAGPLSTQVLQREVALVLLRQRLGADFRRTGSGAVELWTETTLSSAVAAGIYATLLDDAAAVQTHLGRPFRDPPAVFLFTSRASFADALVRHFGFRSGTAALLARQAGGLTLTGINAVVINGENVLSGGRPTIFRHELTHVAVHDLAGDAIPAWLDEGLATLVENIDPAGAERATALSMLSNDPRALSIFGGSQAWIDINTALAGNGYGIAAEAVRVLEERIGRTAVAPMLERMAGGVADAAIAAAVGEPVARFVEAFPDRALGGCRQGLLVSGARPDGLRVWHAFGFRSRSAIAVAIEGPGRYAFHAMADPYGVYTGTVGMPMPGGAYLLRVTAASGESTQLAVTLGDPTSAPAKGCGPP